MGTETRKFLFDIQQAVKLLNEFASNKTFDDYVENAMLRSAVERQFEIIGEALSQLAKIDSEVALQITEYQRIIAFRNILIHGYAQVDDNVVWDVLQTKLPTLSHQVEKLLTGS